jgi:hypothetical protein
VYACARAFLRVCVCARVHVRVVQGEELAECVLAGRFLYPRNGATPDPGTNTPTHSPSGERVCVRGHVYILVCVLWVEESA